MSTQDQVSLETKISIGRQMSKQTKKLEKALGKAEELSQENCELGREIAQQTVDLEKVLTEAENASQEKSQILAHVSHDMKSPLTGMAWFMSVLQQDKTLSAEQKVKLGYIQEGIQQLNALLSRILDKARVGNGQIIASPQQVELLPFTQHIQTLLEHQSSPKTIQIEVEVQPEVKTVMIDPVFLRQILMNLLSNAIKYNRENGQVFLKFYKKPRGRHLMVEIKDTGIGIPPDELSQIYTPYYRANNASFVEGEGLGLSFIKKLVELLDGTITAQSEVNVGSTFTVSLPILASKDQNPQG